MRTSRIAQAVCIILLVAVAATAHAEDDGWKMPNLNPFAKKSAPRKKPARATVSDGSSGWQLPKMPSLPKPSVPKLGNNSKRKSRSAEPSTVTKMTDGTKNFFSKSYDVLTPWDNDKKSRSTASKSRSRSSERVAKKDSWFDFSHKSDEEEIQAVNDFLDLPRPTP